jgi:hypothetical protein
MSKTFRYLVTNKLTGEQVKKRRGEASARFKRDKTKQDERLFKREVAFTTWLERTTKDD